MSRDTEHAHSALDNNFDRDGIRDKLEIQQQATALGTQAMTSYAESKQDAAKQQARDEMAASGEPDGLSETEIEQRVLGSATFKAAESEYGVGSPFWTAGTSVSGLLAGALGGNVQSGAAAGAAPVLAKLIKEASGDYEGARIALHTLASAVLAKAQGGNATAGAAGGFIAAASAKTLALAIYGKEAGELAPDEKMVILNLVSALGAAGGGVATGDTSGMVSAGNAARAVVENNFLGATSSDKLDKAVEKIKNGDKSLATANELIKLENADKRSDALVDKFTRDPSQMSSAEQAELAGYLRVYASEMEKVYGSAVSQELVKGLLSGQNYMKRNPDSEAMSKAQTIMNTWGYHKSNASIGDAPTIFVGSVLGVTVKGMAANAAIGTGVNVGVQLTGKDPFSYVDVIMAGITSAATTGKGIVVSAAINMGGAAIGSGIKGEDPTNSTLGAGFGSVAGGVAGKVASEVMKPVVKETASDVAEAAIGSLTSEVAGNKVKDQLDHHEGKK